MDKIEILRAQPFITLRPEVAKQLGSVVAAVLYEQLFFWSDKGSREDGFIYKTRAELKEETGLSEREIRTATETLVKKGWLETKKLMVVNSLTMHYRCKVKINLVLTPTDGIVKTTNAPIAIVKTTIHQLSKRQFYNRDIRPPVDNKKLNKEISEPQAKDYDGYDAYIQAYKTWKYATGANYF